MTDSEDLINRISGAPVTSSMVLAGRVRQEIFTLRPEPGVFLFGINELRHRVGFGPSVVREALNQLTADGLIEIRRGPKGGVYSRGVGADIVTKSLGTLVSMNGTPRAQVIEARLEIEGLCARLAAIHATREDIEKLEGSVARSRHMLKDSSAFAAENVVFHLGVVEATHNDVVIALAQSLRELFFRETRNFAYDEEKLRESQSVHERILERIRSRSRTDAHRLMRDHVRAFNRYVEVSGQAEGRDPAGLDGAESSPTIGKKERNRGSNSATER